MLRHVRVQARPRPEAETPTGSNRVTGGQALNTDLMSRAPDVSVAVCGPRLTALSYRPSSR
eukprot:11063587-Alexandrium_andersonii.AAC.1